LKLVKTLLGGHLWSRGYFFRSVGSTTDQAVEFYIKISQDKKQREKYYSTGNNKNNRATTEDPYIEFLQSKLKQSEQKHEQRLFLRCTIESDAAGCRRPYRPR